jgi:hypothetical protein
VNRMKSLERVFRGIFLPTRNGVGVRTRLPGGKIAFPSRYFWPPGARPQPYSIWLLRLVGETERVAYVAPVTKLADAPWPDTRTGRRMNSTLFWLAISVAALRRNRHGRRRA